MGAKHVKTQQLKRIRRRRMVAQKTKAASAEAAEKAARTDKAASAGQDTVEKVLQTTADALAKGYEQCIAVAKDQIGRLFPSAAPNLDEIAAFNKGNLEAFVAASAAAAKGLETLSQELLAYNQKTMETGIATTKALLGCRTMQDLVEVQANLTRKGFEDWIAEGTKLSELTVKVANQAAEPINARLNEAVERFMKPLAA